MAQLGTTFKKPILIGETGWPSIGRQRNESKPSLFNQARYVREFLQTAHDKNWQYNIIEAVDQPWKRTLEGTVGGYWGLYDTDLNPKFSLTAPVAERHDGTTPIYLAIIGAMLLLAVALLNRENRPSALLAAASLGGLAGLVGLLQYDYLIAACRNSSEWLALGGVAALGWLAVIHQPFYIASQDTRSASALSTHIIKIVQYGLILAAIVSSYLIYTDGRYRDYPNLIFALPVVVLSIGLLFANILPKSVARVNYILCAAAFILALLCLLEEPNNYAAIIWFSLNCLMAISFWPRQKITHS
jgi:hypothetical protein